MKAPHLPRLGLLALLLPTLTGCAGHAENVLLPVSATTVPGVSKVDMLVMSTRAPSTVPGQLYGGERGQEATVSNIVVSIPPDRNRVVGDIQWPAQQPADPTRDFTTTSVAAMPRSGITSWFKRTGAQGHKLFVFVHGYNTTYEEAVYRFAQIVHDAGTRAAPVLFTWPSRGETLQYGYDKESATVSRDALEELLTKAATDDGVTDITLMAHSMGNWIAMEALRQMAIRHGRLYPKITNVILASADLDVDVFKTEVLDIPAPRPRFTLLVSQDDRALQFSQRLAGGVDRLGLIDPSVEPYRSKLAAAEITVIDLTKVRSGDEFNHSKFAESPEIVRLIGARLIEGQSVDTGDKNGSIGQRLTASVAGAVTTAGGVIGLTP